MSILSVGIDLGLTGEHRVVALGEGAQVCDRFSFETSPEGLAKLGERIFRDGSKPMIVLEPTGLAWIPVVLYLKAVCPESRVVRVKLGKLAALRRYLRGQAKSDAIDALTLAKMAFIDPEELDEVYLPPARMHGLERLTRQRERLEMSIAARKNRLGAILRGYLPGFREAFQDPWSCRARAAYKGCLNPFAVVRGGQEALGALLAQAGPRARQAGIEARALYQACEGLVALYEQTMGVGMVDEGFFLDLQEEVYRELHLEDHLRTLPGVGEHTAPVFLAAVGDPKRFSNQAAFGNWTGVVPASRQSSDRESKGLRMTKAGPELMKRALYQAGEQARQWDPQLAHLYWRQMIHHGKTHKQAMGVVMSHLAARILSVLREKRPYQFRGEEGHPLTRAEARRLIQERYTVPQEIRRQRRRRNPRGQENTQTGGQARKRRGMPPATMHEAASAPQSGLGSAIPSELVYASGQAKSR